MVDLFVDNIWPVLSTLLIYLVPLGLVVGIGLMVLMFVLKGGGQYGIIEGYVGGIGAGKTTLATQKAIEWAKARNAVLLSNITVVSDEVEVHLLSMTDDGLDLVDLFAWCFELKQQGRGLVLLLDEVGVIMPARMWKNFPVGLMWLLQQSRKLQCEIIWTAQDVTFVDHQLRTLTGAVHYVRSYPPPSVWRRSKGKRPWLLIASTFGPKPGEHERPARRLGRAVHRYNRRWEAAFDTDKVVLPASKLPGAEALIEAVAAADPDFVFADPSATKASQYVAARKLAAEAESD